MKEKNKKEQTTAPAGGGSIFDAVPGLPPSQNCNVSSGPYSEDLPVGGSTVGEVRRKFSDRFDIDAQAQSIVNGKPVDENYLLNAGESLMFVRHAGEKGTQWVMIEDDTAIAAGTADKNAPKMKINELVERIGPAMSTGPVILPYGSFDATHAHVVTDFFVVIFIHAGMVT